MLPISTQRQNHNLLEGLDIPSGMGTPQEELENVAEEKDACHHDLIQDQWKKLGRWIDGRACVLLWTRLVFGWSLHEYETLVM